MAKNLLNDTTIRAMKAKLIAGAGEIIQSDGDGLQVRGRMFGDGHNISFRYRYKLDGKTEYLPLGEYDSLSLRAAREKCDKARDLIAQGINPKTQIREVKAQKDAEKQVDALRPTVKQLFDLYQRRYLAFHRKDGGAACARLLKVDLFPKLGDVKAREVTRGQIGEILDAAVERGARRIANMLLTEIRQMFQWGLMRDTVAIDPTAGMKKSSFGGEERPRDRTLSKKEIGELFARLPRSGLAPNIQAALRLILATGVRAGEITNATWQHIDKKQREWRIPETKTGVAHLVHLSDFALEQLETMEAVRTGAYLIQGRRQDSPYGSKALSKLVHDRVTVEKPLKRRSIKHAGMLALSGGNWSLHDLRRTMASRMQDLKILPHVIERCLNHTPPSKIVRTYQTSDYMRERREAYIAWGRQLALIAAGETNVIALKR